MTSALDESREGRDAHLTSFRINVQRFELFLGYSWPIVLQLPFMCTLPGDAIRVSAYIIRLCCGSCRGTASPEGD